MNGNIQLEIYDSSLFSPKFITLFQKASFLTRVKFDKVGLHQDSFNTIFRELSNVQCFTLNLLVMYNQTEVDLSTPYNKSNKLKKLKLVIVSSGDVKRQETNQLLTVSLQASFLLEKLHLFGILSCGAGTVELNLNNNNPLKHVEADLEQTGYYTFTAAPAGTKWTDQPTRLYVGDFIQSGYCVNITYNSGVTLELRSVLY